MEQNNFNISETISSTKESLLCIWKQNCLAYCV